MKNFIGSFITQFKKSSFFRKTILSYFVIGCLTFSVFSFISIWRISKNSMQQFNELNQKMLIQACNTGDTLLLDMHNYFYYLYTKDPNIFNAIYSSSINNIDLFNLGISIQNIQNMQAASSLTESIYIFNYGLDKVFSSNSSLRSINDFFDQDAARLVYEMPTGVKLYIPRTVTFSINGDTSQTKDYITLIYKENKQGALVVNINRDRFQQMVSSSFGSNAHTIVFNMKGDIIANSNPSIPIGDLFKKEFAEDKLPSKAESGSFVYDLNGKKIINYVRSGNLGFTYVSVSDYSKLPGNEKALLNSIILSSIVFLLINILAALLFSWLFYQPINKLAFRINNYASGAQGHKDHELSYISNAFDSMHKDILSLRSAAHKYMSTAKVESLKKILNRDFTFIKHSLNDEINRVSICLNGPYYMVVLIKIDNCGRLASHSAEDVAILRYAITNIGEELFSSTLPVEAVDLMENTVAFILNIEYLDVQKLKDIIRTMQNYISQYFGITVTASLGNLVNTIDEISYSYKNAEYAAHYRLTHGTNSIISYSEIINAAERQYDYPADDEKKIMESLKLEKLNAVESNLNNFMDKIRSFSYDEVVLSVLRLLLEIEKVERSYNLPAEYQSTNTNLNTVVTNAETLEELKEYILNRCSKIINNYYIAKNENKRESLINTIVDYVEQNYKDPNLSVEMIAAVVNLTPNYVRSIFKEHKGISLSDYILNKRFDEICRLLLETDISARKIGEAVGLNSSSGYFYTAFKKYTGFTPEQYRKFKGKR